MRALAAATSLFFLALAGCDRESGKEGPAKIDSGRWRVVEIEGLKPSTSTMWIEIVDGAINGGFDGCNHWGFQIVNGKSELVSDAAGCQNSPDLAAYQAVAQAASSTTQLTMDGDSLVLKLDAHSLRAQKLAAN